jgi:hypothetical protein
MSFSRFLLLLALLTGGQPGHAQPPVHNDGFQRHDGTMRLIRNGQPRPMLHDVLLPNGRTVTRDGFVVEPDGRRTELAEGQGCTLLGTPTAVVTATGGQLALGPTGGPRTAVVPVGSTYQAGMLEQLFGPRGKGRRGWGHYKKHGKHKHGKHED